MFYKDGEAKFVDVKTGIRDSANVQITDGLKVGDTVLITGLLALRPEGKVMLSKSKQQNRCAKKTTRNGFNQNCYQ